MCRWSVFVVARSSGFRAARLLLKLPLLSMRLAVRCESPVKRDDPFASHETIFHRPLVFLLL